MQTEYEFIDGCEPLYSSNLPQLIWTLSSKAKGKRLSESQCLKGNVRFGDEMVGQFDPHRIPPRIAFRLGKFAPKSSKKLTIC